MIRLKTFSALCFSILVHGVYDYLSTDPDTKSLSALVIFLIWLLGIFLIDRLQTDQVQTQPAASRQHEGERTEG